MNDKIKPTRGNGLLERFLAKKRTEIANRLIPSESRKGRLLDIGCGTYPYFLGNTNFREKFGIDRVINKNGAHSASLCLVNFDVEQDDILPFNDGYFNVVTMLAVLEHIEPDKIIGITKECHRILKDGGAFIITTPSWWTDKLLRGMAKLRLVSPEEIAEHKDVYHHSKIAELLLRGGFCRGNIRFGYFVLSMNMWARATK